MRSQQKRLHESRYFRLSRCRSKTGRVYYAVILWNPWPLSVDDEERIRDMIDPQRNRSGRNGVNWKYTNRKDAEQMYSMLLLRWA